MVVFRFNILNNNSAEMPVKKWKLFLNIDFDKKNPIAFKNKSNEENPQNDTYGPNRKLKF